jgi:hypothetical protein
LNVNGRTVSVTVDDLDRDELGLDGARFGCGVPRQKLLSTTPAE